MFLLGALSVKIHLKICFFSGNAVMNLCSAVQLYGFLFKLEISGMDMQDSG